LKRIYSMIAFSIVVIFTLGSSLYAEIVLGPTELVHFWVPFPAVVTRPVTVPIPGGGTVFARPILVEVHKQGIFKRAVNPWVIGLSTHWLVNVGDRSYRIGLRLVDTTLPVKWEVSAGTPWDPGSKTFARPIESGKTIPELGIDWFFYIPEDVRPLHVWYSGGLVVFDADSGETLTFLPITIRFGG